jgi:hypothetical protein
LTTKACSRFWVFPCEGAVMPFHFFQPSLAKRRDPTITPLAVKGAVLDALVVRSGTPAAVGLWGNGYNGDPLDVWAYRDGRRVSGSPSAPVKLSRTFLDRKLQIQEFRVTGLKEGDTLVGVSTSGRRMTDELPVYELRNTASGLMREAALYDEYRHTAFKWMCPYATPYLALRDPKMGEMVPLNDLTAKAIMNVHGLAVHTTAGKASRPPFLMARWGCVDPWNKNNVNAHFGVSGDGTLVQFVPITFVAYAQYSPGNEHWISVEVDNNGKEAMNARQLKTVQKLFWWLSNTFGVPRQVATGCLFPKTPQFDKVTTEVCDRGDVALTTNPYEACMSSGVSCHWWLEASKNKNSHACPGRGILNQLDEVARGL